MSPEQRSAATSLIGELTRIAANEGADRIDVERCDDGGFKVVLAEALLYKPRIRYLLEAYPGLRTLVAGGRASVILPA